LVAAQRMGEEFPAPTVRKSRQAVRLVSAASLVGLALGVLLTAIAQPRKRS